MMAILEAMLCNQMIVVSAGKSGPETRETAPAGPKTPASLQRMGELGAGVAGHPKIPKPDPVPLQPAPR